MTYQNHPDYLCTKLQNTFSKRFEAKIASSYNVRSSSPVKVRPALREVYSAENVQNAETVRRPETVKTYDVSNENTAHKQSKSLRSTEAATNNTNVEERKTFDYLYDRYAGMRAHHKRFDKRVYEAHNPGVSREVSAVKEKKSFGEKVKYIIMDVISRDDDEMKVRFDDTRKVLKKFAACAACVVAATALLLTVLYTSSQYSSISAEVNSLRNEETALLEQRDKLTNLLGVKDDIREIEDYAVNEIGMVKSDYVETRYVSIAGGEHIDVIAADEDGSENIFSTLLSAMGGNWERLMDFID